MNVSSGGMGTGGVERKWERGADGAEPVAIETAIG